MSRVRSAIISEREFAAHSAHEMRTPLAAARAHAQRLAAGATDASTQTNALALVRQLDLLTHLASRLLEIARIESGVALGRAPVGLGLMASLVVDEFADARHDGRLQTDLPGAPDIVDGDIDALGIALRNLIDNALKHAGPMATVIVSVRRGQLSVADDGPGVDPALLPTLVRKFARGPDANAQGSGLGLAMVATIASQSGARLALASRFASGRGFKATLHFGGEAPA